MIKNPRILGDDHVIAVNQALLLLNKKQSIDHFSKTVKETVKFIKNLYPDIKSVVSKFDLENSNNAKDITLYLNDNKTIPVNLFLIRKGGRIQPKNPGAKSFFEKYFLSRELQLEFNRVFEKKYKEYLNELLSLKETHYLKENKELKKLVSKFYPKFSPEIEYYREKFLYGLRETCFRLFKDFYNEKSNGFFHAFNVLFMTSDLNIITSYNKNQSDVHVTEFNPGKPSFDDIEIYKVGKYSVGIKYGEVALTLRFKFESGPTSSIKLAASYDELSNDSQTLNTNNKTMRKMKDLIDSHQFTSSKNSSNAIGKCHESLTYYYFLKEFPTVSQVEPDECVKLMSNYYNQVSQDVLFKLYNSTSTLVPVIIEKLMQKYQIYNIESIELVPDSYITDKLNTGDLQLILTVRDKYIVENVSLKALAKKSSKITTKNPGIGTIIGPTYFNIGSMDSTVKEVKSNFEAGTLDHKKSLEVLANEIGLHLKLATQEQLKQGIENLLGKAMMGVTYYEDGISYCKEHANIDSFIEVFVKTPTPIQNTLAWNHDSEAINLRVKFSRGQEYGWSSIKLTSEYQVK